MFRFQMCLEFSVFKKLRPGGAGALLIPALGRQIQVDLCELEASLVYRVSSRTLGLHSQTLSPKKEKEKKKKNPEDSDKYFGIWIKLMGF